MQEQKRQKAAAREKQAVVSSQEVIEKIRADMEKGLEGLSGAYEEEHRRQLQMMEDKLAGRNKQVEEAKHQKEIENLRKAEQAELEKRREHDKVRELRKKRELLTQTITNG